MARSTIQSIKELASSANKSRKKMKKGGKDPVSGEENYMKWKKKTGSKAKDLMREKAEKTKSKKKR